MDCPPSVADGPGPSRSARSAESVITLSALAGLEKGTGGESEASPNETASAVPGSDASGKKIDRSQAGNGAVKGERVRTTNHAAHNCPSIGYQGIRKISANHPAASSALL
jgi:hypothetical protein